MEFATAAAGALLSASFEKLFDMLASPELRQFVSNTEVQSQLHQWEVMLPKIHAVLEDAQDKQSTSRLVQIWLSELKDLVYDVEDILDEFATEALRLKLKEATSGTNKVKKFLSICGSSRIKFISRMGSKLKEITGRMETIFTQKSNLDLGDKVVGVGRESSEFTPTTSLPDTHFFGRDTDMQAILHLLLADGVASVSVIPIQGMGGLGKTTLAQQLYNDHSVKLRFDLRAWACVSDTFDILSITKTILRSVGGGTCEGKTLDEVQVSLEKALSENKFLIVLDDVWNEKYEDWTVLYKPFRRGAPGSKIIVTTRNGEVARLTGGATPAYHLGELSYEDCLSLFSQHALGANNFDGHSDLKDIGEKIVEKCKGLPLAAKTLGGLLRTKLQQRDEWVDILESPIWHLPEEKCNILPALRLSYHHLPSKLKQCFAYCALFPKDYEFDMNELALLWMAEGFLSHPKRSKRLEDVGVQYFNALLSRSFFQLSSKGCARFVMHDLIHDVAQDVAGDICFHLDDSVETREHLPTQKTRHSSFIRRDREVWRRFEVYEEGKSLRTLLPLPIQKAYGGNVYHISVVLLDRLLSKLRNLRAFSISGYRIEEVPGCVNGLKHLRYLNLSETDIKLLPDFVCSLLNLQILLLTSCNELEKLPSSIGNLPNLCHLDIRQTNKLKEMPSGISNLTELQSLGKFIVGLAGEGGLNIRELKNLSKLKGKLSLEGLQNVEKTQDARDADLKGKEFLKKLVMRWNSNLDDPISNESDAAKVFELLQPHTNLETLVIESYCGLKFPSWFGNSTLMSNVVKIELSNCWKSTSIPCLGRLPMLKHLIIKGMKEIKTLGFDFFGNESGGFQSLETLKLQDMQGLEKWCLCGNVAAVREYGCKLPNLLELEIVKCPVLVGECLVSLPSLRKLELEECNESVLRCMIDMNSLKSLIIRKMSGLCCLHDSGGFQSLETLKLQDMQGLEKWCLCGNVAAVRDSGCKLPNLLGLEIVKCPVLVGECLVSLPSLRALRLEECNESVLRSMIDMNSLTTLSIEAVSRLSCLHDSVGQLLVRLEDLKISNCEHLLSVWQNEPEIEDDMACLRSLEVKGCPQLVSFLTRTRMKKMASLEKMIVRDCPKISSEQGEEERNDEVKSSGSLKQIVLHNCGDRMVECVVKGVMLGGEESCSVDLLEIKNCDSLQHLSFISKRGNKVRELRIEDCKSLVSISNSYEKEGSIVEIEGLEIDNCPSLTTDGMKLLVAVKKLELRNCMQLESVAEESIILFDENHNMLSTVVEDIKILDCPNLKRLPDRLHQLTNLARLVVSNCDGLELFPENGLPLPNLERLDIIECKNLKSGPKNMQNLTSLKELDVRKCRALKSFAEEGGLPPNIINLDIRGCPDVIMQQMLEPLTSLEVLWIGGGTSIKGMLLPATLKILSIVDMSKLESISSSTSPSSSSKCLHLHKNLTSLTSLYIGLCPKLRELPKEGLPPTLEWLSISRCPNLQSRCVKGKGKYWPRISLIPVIIN